MSEQQEANMKRVGQLITEGYKAAGYTRRSFAPVVGVSERSMYSFEVGQFTPRMPVQRKIEEHLGWTQGAISEVLSLGPSVDLQAVGLAHMKPATGEGWGPMETGSSDSPLTRLNMAAADIAILLREKDLENERLQERISALEAQVKELQDGYGLAADDTPNQGRRLRSVLDSVEENNIQGTDS